MANTVQIKRGSNASVNAHTGPSGELIYNLDTGRLHAQDGATAGGKPHALISDVDLKANAATQVIAGDGLTGGGTLAASRTLALNITSIASLAKADTAVQPAIAITAGTGLTGGGTLAASRTVALNAASIASLAKADSAIQAPGGSTGQILAKNSNTTNDVAWVSSAAATAVSYGPQTLTEAQQVQARQNIQADHAYDTIAIATAATVPAYANAIRTNGYYSAGDGGGALYKRVSSEPSHAGKIQSADGAWWELSEAAPLITMFGAIADGVTDVTSKWQDALNYLKFMGSGEGGAVGVPSNGKKYIVKGGLVAPVGCRVEIYGIGFPQVLFDPPAVDVSTDFLNVGATEYSGEINVIRNISIWGNGTSGRRCINGEFLSNLKLYDVFMYNFVGWCVYAKDCYCFSFEGGQCVGNPAGSSEGGIFMSRGTGNQGLVSHVRLNDFKGLNKTALTIVGNTTDTHYGLRIENCAFEFNYHGIYSQAARGLTVDTCYFEFNTASNITVNGTGDTVHSVSILNNALFEGGASGCVFINCNGLWIAGNSFQHNSNCYIEDAQGRYDIGINTFTNGSFLFSGTTPRKNYENEAAWLSFASTWISSGTQPSLGNGSLVFKYKRSGNTVECSVTLTIGSTSTFGSIGYGFRLPFNVASGAVHIGKAGYYDASSDATVMQMTAVCEPGNNYVSLRNDAGGVVGPTSPITFASGDIIFASFTYECAN